MAIICFFGPDGSGKSTLTKGLLELSKSHNVKCKVSWMRGTHTVASFLSRVLFKQYSIEGGSDNPFQNIRIPSRMRRIWQIIEFFSTLPVLLLRFVIPSFLGSFVLAERFVVDFVVWVSQITNDDNYLNRFDAKFLLALARRAQIVVYVTASLEKLAERSKINLQMLRGQLHLYDSFAFALDAYKLDTTLRTADESLNEITNIFTVKNVW